ncbi:MAG: glycogen synthase [Candidatus Helarchaeota archaeon]
MKVAFISSESIPYVKTGGLADVSGALSQIMKSKKVEILNFLPFYRQIKGLNYNFETIKEDLEIPNFEQKSDLLKHYNKRTKLTTYFIKNEFFFNRAEIYNDYEDNPERFIFFSKAVLNALKIIDFKPDIIHCHDWQTSPIPILLKSKVIFPKFFKRSKILLTIHNLAFQGIGNKDILQKLGLDESYFVQSKLEFHGKINLLKGGIIYSDFINTVSETYSKEIQTDKLGFGLKNELILRKSSIFGILNGIDYSIWNPEIDEFIWKQYSYETIKNKNCNKNELLKSLEMEPNGTPLIGMVSRITEQKGFDLIIEILDKLMEMDLNLIILGTGQKKYHEILKQYSKKYPEKIAVKLEFNNILAHQIEAGSDMFLMPSSFEPCGLNQMISLKYGTIPIVYNTGGLADTIKDIRLNKNGNGFVFKEYKSESLYNTIKEALRLYNNKEFWLALQKNAMNCDFSWNKSANKYYKLYQRLLNFNRGH